MCLCGVLHLPQTGYLTSQARCNDCDRNVTPNLDLLKHQQYMLFYNEDSWRWLIALVYYNETKCYFLFVHWL